MILRILQNRITGLNSFLKRSYINLFNISTIQYKVSGVKLKLHLKNDVDRRLFLYGFEKDVLKYFRKVLKNGDIVLDIGANFGIYSLVASQRLKRSGKIYAFEPAHNAYSSLLDNIKLNGIDNIIPIKVGVSSCSGNANFNVCDDDAYNSLGNNPMKPIIKSEKIDLLSVDDFIKNNKIAKVDIIKVDTEGAEYLVFKGAESTLRKYKPMLFFEYNPAVTKGFSNSTYELVELIRSHGYELYKIKQGKLFKIEKGIKIIASEIIAF